jgi:zinc-binding alcohol dehydrogenase/oxidoreductase
LQAVVVHEGGRLAYEQFPDPEPAPGQVVVELRAAAVNRRDLFVRNPRGPAYAFDLPLVPGSGYEPVASELGAQGLAVPVLAPA